MRTALRFLRRKREPAPPAPLSRRVRELEIVTARLIRAGFAGEYHAAFHGRGIEFSQVREYQPGDDIRTIEWNVTARSGVPHVKEFVEERDLSVVIVLDVSGSMAFGSVDRRKVDLAAELVAVIAFAALQNGDRVGLVLAGARPLFIPPARGRKHVEVLVRSALDSSRKAAGTGSLAAAAAFVGRIARKRSVVIFLSDFLDNDQKSMERLNDRHDVVAIVVGDPREQRMPESGLVTLVDAESGRRATYDLRGNRMLARALARQKGAFERFRKSGIDAVEVSTAVPYDRALLKFFRERVARRKR
jgi:uncharacterized protein (DUF58 family)